ncbi:flavodoxin family protein [Actinotalea sp. K2]|uniref:flavodoxin family protein n=1 Tax=Actinotalea sp. K2 TaxID=2939438 RepID=UPI002016ECAB|nr:flavodoxin family protein [Actinotalea sp. K2]MCL3861344.1 flavodoxin/nitric oxide synthase [Actinotalea sp. K2]
MSALVVYESMFGSTRAVAEAVGEGLRECGPVRVVEVGELIGEGHTVRPPDDVSLLVVGGPTHALGMSRASTREDAALEAPDGLVSAGPGLREWLEGLSAVGLPFAAFDTKVLKPNIPGSAAKVADKMLRRAGGRRVAPARSFRVHGKNGGLVEGELEAAAVWGRELGGSSAVVH